MKINHKQLTYLRRDSKEFNSIFAFEQSETMPFQILKDKARERSFELGDEVIDFLIRRVDRDLTSLLTILDEIDHASLAEKRKITIPFIKEYLGKDAL